MATNKFEKIFLKLLPEIIKYNNGTPYLTDFYKNVIAPIFDELKDKIDKIPDLFDAYKCPAHILPYLATFLGVKYNTIEGIDVIRKKIDTAVQFYRKKGLYDSYKIIFYAMNYYVRIYDLYSPVTDTLIPWRYLPEDEISREQCESGGVPINSNTCTLNPMLPKFNMVYRNGLSYNEKYKTFKRMEDIMISEKITDIVELKQRWFKTPHFDIEFNPFASENETFRTDYDSFKYYDYKNVSLSFPTKTATPGVNYVFFGYNFTNELVASYISDVNVKNANLQIDIFYKDGTSYSTIVLATQVSINEYLLNKSFNNNSFPYINSNNSSAISMKFTLIPVSDTLATVDINGILNVIEVYTKILYSETTPVLNAHEVEQYVEDTNLPISTVTDLMDSGTYAINRVKSMNDFANTDYYIDKDMINYFIEEIDYYRPAHTVPNIILKIPFFDDYYSHDIDDVLNTTYDSCFLDRITSIEGLSQLKLIADNYLDCRIYTASTYTDNNWYAFIGFTIDGNNGGISGNIEEYNILVHEPIYDILVSSNGDIIVHTISGGPEYTGNIYNTITGIRTGGIGSVGNTFNVNVEYNGDIIVLYIQYVRYVDIANSEISTTGYLSSDIFTELKIRYDFSTKWHNINRIISTEIVSTDVNTFKALHTIQMDTLFIPDNIDIWNIGKYYYVGDLIQSVYDKKYYKCIHSGISAGNDTDLLHGSDTGCVWEYYVENNNTVNVDDVITLYDDNISSLENYELSFTFNNIIYTINVNSTVLPSNIYYYPKFIEDISLCDIMHVSYTAPYLSYNRSGKLISYGYTEYMATTILPNGNKIYYRIPEQYFSSVETIYNNIENTINMKFTGNTVPNSEKTISLPAANIYYDTTILYSSGIEIPITIFVDTLPDDTTYNETFVSVTHNRRINTKLYRDEYLHFTQICGIRNDDDNTLIVCVNNDFSTTINLVNNITTYYFYYKSYIPIRIDIEYISENYPKNKFLDWFDYNTPSYGWQHFFSLKGLIFPVWTSLTEYKLNDIVIGNDGKKYICTKSGISGGTGTDLANNSDTGCNWNLALYDPQLYYCKCSIDRSGVAPYGFLNYWGVTHSRELEPFDNGYKTRNVVSCNSEEFDTYNIPPHTGEFLMFNYEFDLLLISTPSALAGNCGDVPFTTLFQVLGNTITNAISYEWNFGDGSANIITTVPTIYHTYTTESTFTAYVTITYLDETVKNSNNVTICTHYV